MYFCVFAIFNSSNIVFLNGQSHHLSNFSLFPILLSFHFYCTHFKEYFFSGGNSSHHYVYFSIGLK